MAFSSPEERLGTMLADKYRLDTILGKGGMGVVFGGVHTWTEREVAIKVLLPQFTSEEEVVRRFLNEAKAASRIKGKNVIEILDMGQDLEAQEVYLVMEKLSGVSLRRRLKKGPLSIPEAIDLLTPVMDALAEAHEQHIVHRDLKPDNIHLHEEKGQIIPKLLDFGIAKMRTEAMGEGTATGSMLGTPWYMSPEQTRGKKNLGPPSDVWSIAVVFYVAVSGKMPYKADGPMDAVFLIGGGTPMKPLKETHPGIPDSICAAIDSCLQYKPELRPTVEQLAQQLRAARTAMTSEVRLPTGPVEVSGPLAAQASTDGGVRVAGVNTGPGVSTGPGIITGPGVQTGPGMGTAPSDPGTGQTHTPGSWPRDVSTQHPPPKKTSPVVWLGGILAVIAISVGGTIFTIKQMLPSHPVSSSTSPAAQPPVEPPVQPEEQTTAVAEELGAEDPLAQEEAIGEGLEGEEILAGPDEEGQVAEAGSEEEGEEGQEESSEEEEGHHHRSRRGSRDEEESSHRGSRAEAEPQRAEPEQTEPEQAEPEQTEPVQAEPERGVNNTAIVGGVGEDEW